MSPKVQIVLMSYNRPEFIGAAIDSILGQTYQNIDFKISDNSTNSLVEEFIHNNYPNVNFLKRPNEMTMSQHWNQIISEITADYFMMFHDDDVMNKNAVADLVQCLEENKTAVACAGNAKIIRNTTPTDELHNKNLTSVTVIQTIYDFGQRYFDTGKGVNPFPGYMYRTSMVKNLRFNSREAGKHSDVTFLFKAMSLGPIIYTPAITLNYRIHGNNDSVGIDILSLSNLVKFYLKRGNIQSPENKSQEFIIKNYILWLRQVGIKIFKNDHPWRFKIILNSIFKYFLANPGRFLALLGRQLFKNFLF